jgi:hypothetical protein
MIRMVEKHTTDLEDAVRNHIQYMHSCCGRESRAAAELEQLKAMDNIMSCGHAKRYIVDAEEGTHYCTLCAIEANASDANVFADLYESQHDAAMTMMQDQMELDALRAELDEMREALETYEYAIREAEAILGGEYAMEYGPFFEMVKSARAVLAKYPAHPETKEEK